MTYQIFDWLILRRFKAVEIFKMNVCSYSLIKPRKSNKNSLIFDLNVIY